ERPQTVNISARFRYARDIGARRFHRGRRRGRLRREQGVHRNRSLSRRQDRCAAAWPARARGATTQRGIGYLTRRKTVTTTEEDRLGAVSGAARSRELFH